MQAGSYCPNSLLHKLSFAGTKYNCLGPFSIQKVRRHYGTGCQQKKMTFRIQNMSLSRIDLLYRELRLSLLCPFEPNPLLGKPWRWRCSHDDWIYFWIIFTTGHYLIVARNYRKLYGLVPWTHRWIWNERKLFLFEFWWLRRSIFLLAFTKLDGHNFWTIIFNYWSMWFEFWQIIQASTSKSYLLII